MPTIYQNPIATVAAVNGKAFVRNRDAEMRELRPGDVLLEGETIITGPGNSVELAMNDGELIVFSGAQDILLTPDMLAGAAPGSDEAAVQEQTVDDIAAALEAGGDIGDAIEETAAGSGPTDEGNSFVRLGRILETTGQSLIVDPTTPAQTLEVLNTSTGDDDLATANAAPVALDITATVSEDDTLNGSVSATDANNDTLTYSLTGPAPDGLTFNTDGTYTYIPDADSLAAGENTDVVVNYQVNDGNGGTDTATLTITINGENDTPVITPDASISVLEGAAIITGNVTATDAEGDTLTFSLVDPRPAGLTFNADGSYSFDPADPAYDSLTAGENLDLVVTYQVDDGNGGIATDTLTIQITGTADLSTVTLTATDSITEAGGIITYTATVGRPALTDLQLQLDNGQTITIVAGQTSGAIDVIAEPVNDVYLGSASITASIVSISGGNYENLDFTSRGTAVTQVTDVIDTTIASLSADATVAEGGELLFTVTLSNAAVGDVTVELNNGTVLTVLDGETTASGTFTVPDDNVFEVGELITSSIVSVSGGSFENVAISPASVTSTVIDNDGSSPVFSLVGDTTVTEGDSASYTVVLGGVDIAGGASVTLTVESGLAIDSADENVDYNSVDGTLTVTGPFSVGDTVASFSISTNDDGLYEGAENFTVSLTGTTVGSVSGSVVTTLIDSQHNPTVSSTVSKASDEDAASFTVDLLQNASDEDGDNLTVTGIAETSGNDASGVSVAGNSLSVNPAAYNYLAAGESVTLTYTYDIEDGTGGQVSTSATITIDGRNDAPVVSSVISESTNEDATAFSVDLLQNASDADTSNTLSVTNVTETSGNDASGVSVSGNNLSVDPSAYNYLAVGESVTLTYTYDVSDGTTTMSTSATITIDGRNDAPVVSSVITESTNEDATVFSVDLLQNASDADTTDSLSVTNITETSGNDASGVSVSGNNLSVDPSAYNYLAVGESVTLTYTYDVSDGTTTTSTSATITIDGRNDTPEVSIDNYSTNEGATLFVSAASGVLANDSDPDNNSIHVSRVAQNNSGSGAITVNGVTAITTALGGTVVMNSDGSYSYTAPASLDHSSSDSLQDSFSYSASDGASESAWTTVTINVADTAPVAVADSESVGIGGVAIGNVITGAGGSGTGQDVMGSDTTVITEVIYNGTTYTADGSGNFAITTANGEVTINQDGAYRYQSTHSIGAPVTVGGDSLADWTADVDLYGFTMGTPFETPGVLNLAAANGTVGYRPGAGLFIDSPDPDNGGEPDDSDELDTTGNQREAIAVDLRQLANSAQFTVADMDANDSGRWRAYDAAGNFVDSGIFSTTTFTITPSADFRYLVFTGVDGDDDYTISSITYQPAVTPVPDDVFVYTLQDSDGDTSTANLTVSHDTTITAFADTATVYESGLAGGTQTGRAQTVATGNILDNDEGIGGAAGITQVGDGSTTQTPDANGVITLTTASGELLVYTQDYNGNRAGDYQYTLNVANNNGDGATDTFSYTVTDGTSSDTGSFTVNIVDDAPVGTNVTEQLQSSGATLTYNLTIVLDISGSMSYSTRSGQSRLEVAIDSLEALINAVDNMGNVNVQIVPFSYTASSTGWYQDDVHSALDVLNALSAGGGTYYDNALMEVINSNPADIPAADQSLIYFVSDGEPNSGHNVDDTVTYTDAGGNALSGQAAWEAYVAEHADISFGIGIGGASLTDLEQIAYPNDDTNGDGQSDYAIAVSDPADLADTLLQTISQNVISGSFGLLATAGSNGFVVGADGGYISTIVIDGTAYNYNPGSGDPQTISVTTQLGGLLALNFVTGEYSYSIDLQESRLGEQELFPVTVIDNDGDSTSVTLQFTVDYVADADANRDIVLTNIHNGSVIEIPGLALLHNDAVTADTVLFSTGNPFQGAVSGTDNISFVAGASEFGATATAITEDAADSESNQLNGVDFVGGVDNAIDFTDRSLFGTVSVADAANVADSSLPTAKFSGRLDAGSGRDQDWLKVNLKAGERITFDIDNGIGGSESVDTYIYLYDSAGNLVQRNDDAGSASHGGGGSSSVYDSWLTYQVPADGDYYLNVTSYGSGDSGDYDLFMSITPVNSTSFEYTIDNNGNQDTTLVDITEVAGTTITGSDSDEILIAGATDDTLNAGGGDDVLMGNAGNDTLSGGDGDDLLIGGQGDDLLIGGLGVDVFKWELNDEGSTLSPARDTISQFDNSVSGDVLDLSDLLINETQTDLDNYLHFEAQGSDTVIYVSTTGAFAGGFSSGLADQSIVVENTDLTSGFADQQAMIQDMLDSGKLITD